MSYYIHPSISVMNRQRLLGRAFRIRITYHWEDEGDILPFSNPALESNDDDEFEELPDLEEVD